MSAIAYIRVSTQDQAENGYSMEAQQAAIEKHLGAKPDREYSDDESGASATRPGLLAMLAALKPGDVIYVAKRDRLARDMMLSCWIEKEIKKHGAMLVSVAGEGNGDTPADQLMRRMIDAFAEFERQMISARTCAALQVKKQRGERTGGIPYGKGLAKDGKTLIENHHEQDTTAMARQLRDKKLSFSGVADELNRIGYHNRRGNDWTAMGVFRILKKEDIKNGEKTQ